MPARRGRALAPLVFHLAYGPVDAAAFEAPTRCEPGPGTFLVVAPAEVTRPGRLGYAVATEWARGPLSLQLPAPDPEGLEVPLVEDRVSFTQAVALGLGAGLEGSLRAPITMYQRGAGPDVLRSRRSILPSTAVHDPAVGLAFAAPVPSGSFALRAEALPPLGDAEGLAGGAGWIARGELAVMLRYGRWHLGADARGGVRRERRLGSVTLGSTLGGALGVGVQALDGDTLLLALETWAEQPLATSRSAAPLSGLALVAAEGWLTARFQLGETSLFGGTGLGLPLASATREEPGRGPVEVSGRGPGAAAYRALLGARWAR